LSFEIIIVLIILTLTVFAFISEKLSVDVISILAMLALVFTGILTPDEGVKGFSNHATITVACMFILSSGLYRSGALKYVGKRLTVIMKKNFLIGFTVMMISVGFISAFINNTPVVAIMIPIIATIAAGSTMGSNKMMMGLSFAAMMGGLCTLIGTSTTILVSGLAEDNGIKPFSMFEMAPMGLVFFAVGITYMLIIGRKLVPERSEEIDLTTKFGLGNYLIEIELLPEALSVGKRIEDAPLVKDLDIEIVEIRRNNLKFYLPTLNMVLEANDILKVQSDVHKIMEMQNRVGIRLKSSSLSEKDFFDDSIILLEAVIAPNSELDGTTLKQVGFKYKYNASALAIKHHESLTHEKLGITRLRAGDALLLEVKKENLDAFRKESLDRGTFIFISETDKQVYKRNKIVPALLIILGVILAVSAGFTDIMTAAVTGSVLMVVTGCITPKIGYQSIDWKVIILLAGTLSLGTALQKSGAADMLSSYLVQFVTPYGPVALISGLFLITSVLTGFMSNNATAVLLVPIAIAAAHSMGVDVRACLITVAFAASSSFFTPVGYQTNTMIYGAGNFRFSDFVKVGLPLNIIFWILATLLIPRFFPL
jgi:di/tricarboxylate transporter